ncbi:hypothetical protein LCGC14_2540010 [marine sediment metagenome]|uniref:Uncharacterized protein n=1 Tax=marine sediment metagenome TaxID=412755 RepID=A0A0F9ARE3_9ZZZZ
MQIKIGLFIILFISSCFEGPRLLNSDDPELAFISQEVVVLNNSLARVTLVVTGRTQAGYFVDVETTNMGMVFPRFLFIAMEGETLISFDLPVRLPDRIVGQLFNDFQPTDTRKRFLPIDLKVER